MSVNWIATNPKSNVKNLANQISMSDQEFENLMRTIVHNRNENGYDEKLEILLLHKGFFSAEQAAHVLSAFPRPKDRLKCVKILEPKLVPMTCQQGKNILAAVSVEEDRLEALQYIKRVLNDANTQEGVDNIISTFTYHDHKCVAIQILQTIVSKKGVKLAAGGHQGYAPLGGLYTSAPPNNNHVYGPSIEQVQHLPNHKLRVTEAETLGFGPFKSSIYNSNLADPKNSTSYGNYNQYITPNQYLNPNKI